jgi:hypothetical protein
MVFRHAFFSVLSMPSLLAGLALPAASQADDKANSHRPVPMQAKKAAAVSAAVKFEEAQMLREAFILLAGGNHDYNGHRAKAMAAVKSAVHILDEGVMKHGSPQMKSTTRAGNAVVASASSAARNTPQLHERQPVSDAQLRKAELLLAQVRATLARNNQSQVLRHVETAIKEIAIALKIR